MGNGSLWCMCFFWGRNRVLYQQSLFIKGVSLGHFYFIGKRRSIDIENLLKWQLGMIRNLCSDQSRFLHCIDFYNLGVLCDKKLSLLLTIANFQKISAIIIDQTWGSFGPVSCLLTVVITRCFKAGKFNLQPVGQIHPAALSSSLWGSSRVWKLGGRGEVALLSYCQIPGPRGSPQLCMLDLAPNPSV